MDEEDRLRDNLNRLLLRCRQGDWAAVIGPAALRTAGELRRRAQGTTPDGRPTMEIVDAYLLGQFHWLRYQVLPPGRQSAEIQPIRQYFVSLLTAAPQFVPEDACELLFTDPQRRASARALIVSGKARELLDRARETQNVTELDEGIDLLRALPVRGLPADAAFSLPVTLSRAWRDRYDWAGDPADLETAIARCRDALATDQPAAASRLDFQGDLDKLLTRRYKRTGSVEHLDDVVAERAARLAAAAGPDRSGWRTGLAASLADRFARRLDPADAREALRQSQAAAAETTGADRGRALTITFKVQSDCLFADDSAIDISDVIAVGLAALELLPEDAELVPMLRTNVGYFLVRRYERAGDSGDLLNALDLLHKAVEAIPDDDEQCVIARARLAEALVLRHGQTVALSATFGYGIALRNNLDEALELLHWCVRRTAGDDARQAQFLGDLARAYRAGADINDQPDLLDGAVEALRDVVALSGDEHRCRAAHELSSVLGARFMALRDEADLAEAIGCAREAVAVAAVGTHEELTAQLTLAEALAMRFLLDPADHENRREVIEVYRRCAHAEWIGLAARVSASESWGRCAHEGGYLIEALAGYESMLALAADLAPIGLDDADRLRRLAHADGRVELAVSCAVAAGQPERAVEFLERGRMMTAPAVSVAAGDVAALRRREPDLAELVDAVHTELTAAAEGNPVLFLPGGITAVIEDREDRRQRRDAAARRWLDTVARVRSAPGCTGFLAPAGFAELRNAALAGPVVVLNASPHGCDALIVRSTGVEALPLPVTHAEMLFWANRYGGAITELNRGAQALGDRQATEVELSRVLSWLWDAAMRPVLDALGLLRMVRGGQRPRVWWSPSGIFSLLPLHAAGRSPEDGVMDRVQSSYAPSLRLLASLNSGEPAKAPDGSPRLLAIGLGRTPRLKNSRLPDVDRELAVVTGACPPGRVAVLRDEQATRAAVQAALPEYDLLHFACHGRHHPRDPSSSRLYLHDGELSVRDLRWASLRQARLAVLSACQTAMSGNMLLDEGLHLGAALHMAGCRDVVGTLWTVPDRSATEIMERLYGHLMRDGEVQPGLAAEALHLAVRELRSEVPDLCGAWAPFVHVGGGR